MSRGRDAVVWMIGSSIKPSNNQGQRHKGFLERHADQIAGVLSGFDRLLFRGTIRSLSCDTYELGREPATGWLCLVRTRQPGLQVYH